MVTLNHKKIKRHFQFNLEGDTIENMKDYLTTRLILYLLILPTIFNLMEICIDQTIQWFKLLKKIGINSLILKTMTIFVKMANRG